MCSFTDRDIVKFPWPHLCCAMCTAPYWQILCDTGWHIWLHTSVLCVFLCGVCLSTSAYLLQVYLSSQCQKGGLHPDLYASGSGALAMGCEAGPLMTVST